MSNQATRNARWRTILGIGVLVAIGSFFVAHHVAHYRIWSVERQAVESELRKWNVYRAYIASDRATHCNSVVGSEHVQGILRHIQLWGGYEIDKSTSTTRTTTTYTDGHARIQLECDEFPNVTVAVGRTYVKTRRLSESGKVITFEWRVGEHVLESLAEEVGFEWPPVFDY